MNEFGAILKKLRNSKGLTQSQLSAILNVNQSAIANWESNTRTPDIYTLKNIASFFKCSTDLLLDNTNEDFNPLDNLSPELSKINKIMTALNKEGQNKLLDYGDDLVQSGKYKKSDTDKLEA